MTYFAHNGHLKSYRTRPSSRLKDRNAVLYKVTPPASSSKLYPAMTSEAFIEELEGALEEAMKLSTLDLSQVITLVTDNGPAMTTRDTARYEETGEIPPYWTAPLGQQNLC